MTSITFPVVGDADNVGDYEWQQLRRPRWW